MPDEQIKSGNCDRCGATQSKVFRNTKDMGSLCHSCYRWRERQKNPEGIKAAKKAVYERNKAEGKERVSWAKKNPEKAHEYGKKRRAEKGDAIKETRAKWYEKNKEEIATKNAERYAANREKILSRKRERLQAARLSEEQVFFEIKDEELPSPISGAKKIRNALSFLPKEEDKA